VQLSVTEIGQHGKKGGGGKYLAAVALYEAPVRDVADLGHEGQVQHRIPQDASLEALRMLPQEVTGQETPVASADDRHPVTVCFPCQRNGLQAGKVGDGRRGGGDLLAL